MRMVWEQLHVLQWLAHAFLFVACSVLLFHMLNRLLPRRKQRWPKLGVQQWIAKQSYPQRLLRLFAVTRESPSVQTKARLLVGAGFQMDVVLYELLRRMGMAAVVLLLALGATVLRAFAAALIGSLVYGLLGCVIVLLMLLLDHVWLDALGQQRRHRITKEMYLLSTQLLYYANSNMNLHTKLSRCVPFARTIRSDVQLLLHEWYNDAAEALRMFKKRLGTDEAYSFAETLHTLHLHESDHYYALLRERIRDYKEKLELAKDSRKETVSYALFVLAGIPILNTFRIFVYPWVMEGQKLFDALQ